MHVKARELSLWKSSFSEFRSAMDLPIFLRGAGHHLNIQKKKQKKKNNVSMISLSGAVHGSERAEIPICQAFLKMWCFFCIIRSTIEVKPSKPTTSSIIRKGQPQHAAHPWSPPHLFSPLIMTISLLVQYLQCSNNGIQFGGKPGDLRYKSRFNLNTWRSISKYHHREIK